MLMRALKIGVLFGTAALGIYLGFQIEQTVLWVFYEHPYGYEYVVPFPLSWALHQFHHFLIGVMTSVLTISASRLVRFPDIVAIAVIFVASIPYFPLFEILMSGESLSFRMLRGIVWFQAGYFIGMFTVLGVWFFVLTFVWPFVRRRST